MSSRLTPTTDRRNDRPAAGNELDPTQRRYVESIRAAGTTLLTVIDDVLDYSKLESGQIKRRGGRLRPSRTHRGRGSPWSPARGAKRTVEVVGLLPARFTRGALRGGTPDGYGRLLLNLAGNAGEVHRSRRGRRTGDRGRGSQRKAGSVTVRFEVVDTGIGISVENRDRLFDVFARPTPPAPGARRHRSGLAISSVWSS